MADNQLPTPTPLQLGSSGDNADQIKPPPSTLMPAPKPAVGENIPVTPMPTPVAPPKMEKEQFGSVSAPTPDQLAKIVKQSQPVGPEIKTAVKKESPTILKPGEKKNGPKLAVLPGGPLKKFLPFIIGGVVLLIVAIFVLIKMFGGSGGSSSVSIDETDSQSGGTGATPSQAPTKQVVLTYWGLWESDESVSPVLREFEQAHPGVLVKYVKQSPKDYRERLQTAIASGQGPDIFRFHASWVPMLKDDLSAMPTSVMSPANFKQAFYPIASQQLQVNGQIVGLPLMYDNLMLYYNEEIFNTANLQPPKTWAELKEMAVKLTIKEKDEVKRGGIALGNASNVEHFSDVLGLLMLQNGADFTKPTSKAAQDAITFYTNFVKVDKVWSDKLPSSTAAFARGDVAMMFAPSWRVHDVKAINPNLKFKMVAVPKLASKEVTWATYWAEGVNSKGKNSTTAWELLKFLGSSETMKKLYANQSQIRSFGEPYSLVSLASNVSTDQYVSPVLAGAPSAQNWYLNSFTHDNGINDQLIKYYKDAVNSVLTSGDVGEVMDVVEKGTAQVLRQYGVN